MHGCTYAGKEVCRFGRFPGALLADSDCKDQCRDSFEYQCEAT